MAWAAAVSFNSVNRVLDRPHPVATSQFKALGRADARLLLRYQVAEQNRWYFEKWETAQIVMGALFLFFVAVRNQGKQGRASPDFVDDRQRRGSAHPAHAGQ